MAAVERRMSTNAQEMKALRAPRLIGIRSPAFEEGKPIPRQHTAFGDDVSPELHLTGVPGGAVALAIVVDDPDAPRGTFTHWTAWNLPPDTTRLVEGADPLRLGARVGQNDFGLTGYNGPKPPSGTHRYRFRVFALDKQLDLPPNAPPAEVWRDLAPHVVAWGELMGTYARP